MRYLMQGGAVLSETAAMTPPEASGEPCVAGTVPFAPIVYARAPVAPYGAVR